MRTRSRYVVGIVLALGLLLAGCGGDGDDEAGAPAETLTGVIGSIQPPEGEVESFELVRPGEEPTTILVDPGLDYGFDLQHLQEHMDSVDPVRVTLDERDDGLYATAIEDV